MKCKSAKKTQQKEYDIVKKKLKKSEGKIKEDRRKEERNYYAFLFFDLAKKYQRKFQSNSIHFTQNKSKHIHKSIN